MSCASKSERIQTCKGVITNWFGERDNEEVIVVDTPGLGDTEGRDAQHIEGMVRSFKAIGFVNTFLLVVNSQEPRFSQ